MKKILPVVLAALALPAWSDTTTLNFENLANDAKVLNLLAGFEFSDNAKSYRSSSVPIESGGGTGAFYGGADGSDKVAISLYGAGSPGGPATLRVAVDAGFGTHFSVSVAALSGSLVSGTAYSADNIKVGSFSTSDFDGTSGCSGTSVCEWAPLEFDVMGRAAYIELTADEGAAWFDDMVFGALPSGNGSNDVPEPSGILLSAAALGALVWTRRLSRR